MLELATQTGGYERRGPAAAREDVRLQRSHGCAALSVTRQSGATRLDRLAQSGSARLLFPRASGATLEAVAINTSGGLAGGDSFTIEARAESDADLVMTTQAAEKVYRSTGDAATTHTALSVAPGARLHWLPQEAILFEGARLSRDLDVEMAGEAELLIAESVVFGRAARDEKMRSGRFTDRWRVRRDGRLVFAERALFDGDISAQLASPAVTAGAAALATGLLVAPDAEARVDAARAAMQETAGAEGGVSAWNGMLAFRLVAASGQILRDRLRAVLAALRGTPLPRVWQC